MPGPYQNPDIKPCAGTYTWVPSISPLIGGINPLLGFDTLVINRGKFRNYFKPLTGTSSLIVTTSISSKNHSGDIYNPVINATRPLSIINPVVTAQNYNFVVKPIGSVDLVKFTFPSGDWNLPISSIQFTYDLSFWYGDPLLNNFSLNTIQSAALSIMQNNNAVDDASIANFINGLEPPAIKVIGVTSSGEIELGTLSPDGLQITRLRNKKEEKNLQYVTQSSNSPSAGPFFITAQIKTANDLLNRDAYKKCHAIILRAQGGFQESTMVLALKKIMFFTADRVNFRYLPSENQLPCNALGYSLSVNGFFYPQVAYQSILSVSGGTIGGSGGTDASGSFVWPQQDRVFGDNFHIKVFDPDYTTGSPGFAHSLSFHLYILSFPMFGPLAAALGFADAYAAVILGPVLFPQQLIFYGTSVVNTYVDQEANMSTTQFLPPDNNSTLTLSQNGTQVNGFNFPIKITPYKDIIESKTINQYLKSLEYIAVGVGTGVKFQNTYTDQFGNTTQSEVYSGSPIRATQYLQANDSYPLLLPAKKQFSYSTYINTLNPTLADLFTQSDPCLIFKCDSFFTFGGQFTQNPGFISATINAFVTDIPGLFDTKLVYRIYAVQKNSKDFNPNSAFAKNHTFKIIYPKTNSPSLEVSSFDSSWDFTNVLVTGNLVNSLQAITTQEIINTTNNTFHVANSAFDIYCAVYALSEINDNIKGYDLSSYSSLNFPKVTFSLTDDFILVLPVYYMKSFSNGGSLQAERDGTYTGIYVDETNKFISRALYDNGQTYNPTDQYSGTFSQNTGYSALFSLASGLDSSIPTAFSIFIDTGSVNSPSINETDYVILFTDNSRAKIDSGDWVLEFDIDSASSFNNFTNTFAKIEVDLYDRTNFRLVMKIFSSEYQLMDVGGVNQVTYTNQIPFYLPPSNSIVILKLIIKNIGASGIISFKKISLTKNTLRYFQYNGTRPPASAPFGFYEDLPIQPSAFVNGCFEFAFQYDSPSEGYTIYDANPNSSTFGLFINGAIYSPTYVVDLPAQLEVELHGDINETLLNKPTGIKPYETYFRTGTSNTIKVLDTKKHSPTNLIITLSNVKTNSTDFGVFQIVSESYARFFTYYNRLNTVDSNANLTDLSLQYPVMSKSEELLIQESPGVFAVQPGVPGQIYSTSDANSIKIKMQSCPFSVFDYFNFKTYTLGITAQGNLIYAVDQFTSEAQSSNFVLLEGNPTSSELKSFSTLVTNNTKYYGSVRVSFPAINVFSNDDVVVFYVYSKASTGSSINTGSSIYARYINGQSISDPILIFDFQKYVTNGQTITYAFPSINQLSLCKHDVYPYGDEFYLAFDCQGKIFTIKVLYKNHNFSIISPSIIYGNLTTSGDTSTKAFIQSLNSLINNSLLYKLNYQSQDGYNKDLDSSQKVGFIDFDGIIMGIQFLDGDVVKEAVFDKSYSLRGEIRSIGNLQVIS